MPRFTVGRRDNGPVSDDVERFVRAQAGVYGGVVDELRRGRKTSHWIWFIFPQIAGLGRSATSQHYAIGSLDEARAYAAHPVLGARLRECASLLLAVEGRSAADTLGELDAVKVRSSMTLFERAVPDEPLFGRVLDELYGGVRDATSIELIQSEGLR